mgnify:CR=1 FL=1
MIAHFLFGLLFAFFLFLIGVPLFFRWLPGWFIASIIYIALSHIQQKKAPLSAAQG